jgi:hypothetical protein
MTVTTRRLRFSSGQIAPPFGAEFAGVDPLNRDFFRRLNFEDLKGFRTVFAIDFNVTRVSRRAVEGSSLQYTTGWPLVCHLPETYNPPMPSRDA